MTNEELAEEMRQGFKAMSQRFDQLQTEMQQGFSGVGEPIDRLNDEVDAANQRLSRMESSLSAHRLYKTQIQINDLDRRVKKIEAA